MKTIFSDKHIVICPVCSKSDITVVDNEKLSNNDPAYFDTEIRATGKCNHCKSIFKLVGEINWKQPKA